MFPQSRSTIPILLGGLILCVALAVLAETTIPPVGIRQHTPRVHALTGARLVIAPGKVIEKGTVVIRDGNIAAVGASVRPPADARIWDLEGKTVYAGFIDLCSDYGMAKPSRSHGPPSRDEVSDEAAGASYWNARIAPEKSAAEVFKADEKTAGKLRGQGVTLVLSLPTSGIICGTGALVTTGEGTGNELLIQSDVALAIRYETAGHGDQSYPGSLMGAVALLRQSMLDADWYTRAQAAWTADPTFERPEANESMVKLSGLREAGVPLLFIADDETGWLRSARLAQEFGLPAVIRGSNHEYRRLEAIKSAGLPVILPLDFPETPAVKTPEEALDVSLRQLRHWYLAPENASRLHAADVPFAFTGDGLEDQGKFLEAVRETVTRGLPADAALAALTTVPAQIVNRSDRFGRIRAGGAANLVVTDGDLFAQETKILSTWIDGRRYEVTAEPQVDPRGSWDVKLSDQQAPGDTVTLTFEGEPGEPSGKMRKGPEVDLKNIDLSGSQLTFTLPGDSLGLPGVIQMSAVVAAGHLTGYGVWPDGREFSWQAKRTGPFLPAADSSGSDGKKKDDLKRLDLPARYPDGAFGWTTAPAQPKLMAFTNATIWTCAEKGIVENGTLLVAAGKIVGVGERVEVPDHAIVVDARGMHLTPGIIDCHSHTAIDGDVNESNQAISAEVRIGDVINPDDIALYWELAGGLTTLNALHGSANAIGGQNQVLKLRWGLSAEELKFENAPPGIKFALGENPKQSNWGDDFATRYPQTRMGVEEIIRDAFQAALEYEAQWERYRKDEQGMPPRRDLELEAVFEVIEGHRLVHSHAYRADEMLMLMRLAEEYDFRVATFDHGLEGYKIADELAAHGVGVTSFSDWWAYKFEVYDAIPYNGALLYNQGVVVSFNSDSNELARRLNTEAGKAVKYGGVPPSDALKFVTINAAIQLGIDDRVGSLEPGKDADFTLWNGDPLSTYTACEQTWIDGRKYFDRKDDQAMREEVRAERALLIQRALQEGDGAKKKGDRPGGHRPPYSCQDEFEGGCYHEDL